MYFSFKKGIIFFLIISLSICSFPEKNNAFNPDFPLKSYILFDLKSGRILAQKNSSRKLLPASLAKLMTLWIISKYLDNGIIKMNDKVHVPITAYKVKGSKIFLEPNQLVKIKELIQGIIVSSGNDACITIAEYLLGNEKNFVSVMNKESKILGMKNSHFMDSTGLNQSKEQYVTSKDLAILSRKLIMDFPKFYKWYKKKSFTFNNIKQYNRNNLLWSDLNVDGIKTGYTKKSGYNLISSSYKNKMRLICIVMGAKSKKLSLEFSKKLLNYGYNFYRSIKLIDRNKKIIKIPVWFGKKKYVNVGLKNNLYLTILKTNLNSLKIRISLPSILKAPILKSEILGKFFIYKDKNLLTTKNLISLENIKEAGFFKKFLDNTNLKFKKWFGK